MILGVALRRRSIPPLRRGVDEHLAHRRASLAQHVVGIEKRAAPARAVSAIAVVLVSRKIDERELDSHALPVRAQLLAQDLRHRGRDTLPHLVLREVIDDIAFRGDANEVAERYLAATVFLNGELRPVRTKGQHQRAGRPCGRGKKISSIHVADDSVVAAACLIAAWMRGYVPHRHRLPDIARVISSSDGCGFCARKAAAFMICPAWQ